MIIKLTYLTYLTLSYTQRHERRGSCQSLSVLAQYCLFDNWLPHCWLQPYGKLAFARIGNLTVEH